MPIAKVYQLVPKRPQLDQAEARRAADGLRGLDLPEEVLAAALAELGRFNITAAPSKNSLWVGGFTMISRDQTAAVWKAIRELPGKYRPNQVRHAFDLVLLNLRQDTGEVMLTRTQIAEEIRCSEKQVSFLMGTLAKLDVIRRERRKVAGMRGPGVIAYFINPHVAWNGALQLREKKAEATPGPLLRIMEGGKAEE